MYYIIQILWKTAIFCKKIAKKSLHIVAIGFACPHHNPKSSATQDSVSRSSATQVNNCWILSSGVGVILKLPRQPRSFRSIWGTEELRKHMGYTPGLCQRSKIDVEQKKNSWQKFFCAAA